MPMLPDQNQPQKRNNLTERERWNHQELTLLSHRSINVPISLSVKFAINSASPLLPLTAATWEIKHIMIRVTVNIGQRILLPIIDLQIVLPSSRLSSMNFTRTKSEGRKCFSWSRNRQRINTAGWRETPTIYRIICLIISAGEAISNHMRHRRFCSRVPIHKPQRKRIHTKFPRSRYVHTSPLN